MKDRRRHRRYFLKALLRMEGAGEFTNVTLESINISAGGIFFRSGTEATVGDQLTLLFALPEKPEPIEARCEVIHQLETIPGKHYFIGVKFLKLDGVTREELDEYLRDHFEEVEIKP